MGFLDISIIATLAMDSGKPLCRDLVPGSRGAAACARAARVRIVFIFKTNLLFIFIFILKPHPDIQSRISRTGWAVRDRGVCHDLIELHRVHLLPPAVPIRIRFAIVLVHAVFPFCADPWFGSHARSA
jgi:hypothetical protein